MRPDEPQQPPQDTPLSNDAAANIVRSQVEQAYDAHNSADTPQQQTHATHTEPTAEQWEHYHSSWQDYYQQYYERYYAHHLHSAKQQFTEQPKAAAPGDNIIASRPEPSRSTDDQTLDKDAAMSELKGVLLQSVQTKAEKVRGSRHFVPISAAIVVMLLFGFMQYNQLLIANVRAYISPGNVDPQNIIVDPSASTKVDPQSTSVVIPKINVNVPVDYDAKTDYDSQMASMKNGLAYFGVPGADSRPGQVGNTPIAGHSSNDVLDSGSFKFIFAKLEKLQKGDTIYANYNGTRYTYTVAKKEVVKPTQVSRLVYETDKPLITLITCTPLGTSTNRLLVTAEQVNPSPASASAAPEVSDQSQTTTDIPGTAPTFLERLFGA